MDLASIALPEAMIKAPLQCQNNSVSVAMWELIESLVLEVSQILLYQNQTTGRHFVHSDALLMNPRCLCFHILTALLLFLSFPFEFNTSYLFFTSSKRHHDS